LVECPEKTTDLQQVTDKLYHLILWVGFKLTALVVIGTDCIGSYKSNYHIITTTTALILAIYILKWNNPEWLLLSVTNLHHLIGRCGVGLLKFSSIPCVQLMK